MLRRLVDQLAIELVAIFETSWFHSLGRTNRLRCFFGVRQIHRAELIAEKTGRGERLQLFLLADPFQPLADVDEGGNYRVLRSQHAGHPRPKMWTSHGLRGHISCGP